MVIIAVYTVSSWTWTCIKDKQVISVFKYAYVQTESGSAVVVMRRAATWCHKPKDRAEVTLCLLSQAGMPGTLRYNNQGNEIAVLKTAGHLSV